MPQATAELSKEWDGPMEDVALAYLKKRGYRLTRGWEWVPPNGIAVSTKDFSAITFLVQEWDFGGIIEMQDNSFRYKIEIADPQKEIESNDRINLLMLSMHNR